MLENNKNEQRKIESSLLYRKYFTTFLVYFILNLIDFSHQKQTKVLCNKMSFKTIDAVFYQQKAVFIKVEARREQSKYYAKSSTRRVIF